MVSLRAYRRATNRHPAPESRWPRQANSLNPKPRRASPRTLRSHAAEEEKDQSSTANPVYSFPGRRDHHLGPCLPRVARNGRPAPYPTLHGESALPFFGASIPGFVGLLTGRGPFSPAFALIPGRSGKTLSRWSQQLGCGTHRSLPSIPCVSIADERESPVLRKSREILMACKLAATSDVSLREG